MRRFILPFLILLNLLVTACVYIVLPKDLDAPKSKGSKGWSAAVTQVSQTDGGDLRIELAIRNETNDWSTMKAVEGKPAVLTTGEGKKVSCETVMVGTGGHRLAPGFQMRGYTSGTVSNPKVQLNAVECKGIQAAPHAKLAIDYVAYTGDLDYYHQEKGDSTGTITLNLDQVATDLSYPVFSPVEGLIQKPDTKFLALSDNVISLLDVKRADKGFEFKWQNENPTDFPLKIHIGNPPVIGADGIIYGIYEIMDLASTPLTPAKGKVDWSTTTEFPAAAKGFYILLSVESKNMRLYVNYALDITNK